MSTSVCTTQGHLARVAAIATVAPYDHVLKVQDINKRGTKLARVTTQIKDEFEQSYESSILNIP